MKRMVLLICAVITGVSSQSTLANQPRNVRPMRLSVIQNGGAALSDGQQKAREAVQAAIEAAGGEARLRAIKSLQLIWQGYRNLLEQSERPEGPWIPQFERATEQWDLVNHRFYNETETKVVSAFSFTSKLVVAGGIAGRGAGSQWGPGTLAQVQEAEEWVELSPFRALLNALESSGLRAERDTVMQGVLNRVVAFNWKGRAVRLYLNSNTSLPTVVELVNAYPYDVFWNVWGDVTTRVYWSFWDIDPSGLEFPRQLDIERNGQPFRTLMVESLKLNPDLADNTFDLPDNVRAGFETGGKRTMDERPLGIPSRPSNALADGVTQIPGSWYVTIVRQVDGLVIIEAPISSGYSAQVIAEAQRRYPNIPIKAVISTSDAWPHFGGVREYVARGIPVYALDLNVPILKRMMGEPRRLIPDALARAPRKPRLRVVSAKTVIGSGPNRLELYPIRTESGERMMMAYFPELHLLYGSDLVQPDQPGKFHAPYAYEISQAVKREGLKVDTVIAMHSDPAPWSKVLDSFSSMTAQTPEKR